MQNNLPRRWADPELTCSLCCCDDLTWLGSRVHRRNLDYSARACSTSAPQGVCSATERPAQDRRLRRGQSKACEVLNETGDGRAALVGDCSLTADTHRVGWVSQNVCTGERCVHLSWAHFNQQTSAALEEMHAARQHHAVVFGTLPAPFERTTGPEAMALGCIITAHGLHFEYPNTEAFNMLPRRGPSWS